MNNRVINVTGNFTILDLNKNFPVFAPYSRGSYADCALQTLKSANQCFPLLHHLVDTLGHANLKTLDVEHFVSQFSHSPDAAYAIVELKRLFDYHGSDKANSHNYHLLYGTILQTPASISAVLEIGLGTNNTDVVSNMGTDGKPGASLRAFRDFLPQALVCGADIDKRILFQEERIKTYFVDQTELTSFDELDKGIPNNLDLVIDDGLHAPNANIAVLMFGLRKLKNNGWVIIEDIQLSAISVWHVVAALLPVSYECFLVKTALSFVFAVKKTTEK